MPETIHAIRQRYHKGISARRVLIALLAGITLVFLSEDIVGLVFPVKSTTTTSPRIIFGNGNKRIQKGVGLVCGGLGVLLKLPNTFPIGAVLTIALSVAVFVVFVSLEVHFGIVLDHSLKDTSDTIIEDASRRSMISAANFMSVAPFIITTFLAFTLSAVSLYWLAPLRVRGVSTKGGSGGGGGGGTRKVVAYRGSSLLQSPPDTLEAGSWS